MRLESIIIVALLLSVVSFVVGLVWAVKESHRKNKRLEVAKARNWVTDVRMIDEKVVNKANGRDYSRGRKEMVLVTTYEYVINGKRKRLKVKSRARTAELKQVYYDRENNYQVLNIDKGTNANKVVIIPLVVFVVTILLLKKIFNV